MLARGMLHQLIFPIISDAAQPASVGPISYYFKELCYLLILGVPSLVVLAVPDRGKPLGAVLAEIRFLASVGPHMD